MRFIGTVAVAAATSGGAVAAVAAVAAYTDSRGNDGPTPLLQSRHAM